MFGLYGQATSRCCLFQERELNSLDGHSPSRLRTPETNYALTLDLVILYTHLTTSHTHSLWPPYGIGQAIIFFAL